MLIHPNIDPVALEIGFISIHWYGLMYLFAFASAWVLARFRVKHTVNWERQQIDDLIFYGAIGVIVGGRIGYVLLYDFMNFIADPLILFKIWQGGMSFHGGLLGVLLAMYIFGCKIHKDFFSITDFMAPFIPLGLLFGRLGNFINAELAGRATDVPWAMIFPTLDFIPRHPSQLYELFLEGLVLFLIMWLYSSKPKPKMAVSGLFLLGYGVLRFIVEFFREPDVQLGFVALDWITMGQLLSAPLIIAGAILLTLAYQTQENVSKCNNI